jgi:hypothetical protein
VLTSYVLSKDEFGTKVGLEREETVQRTLVRRLKKTRA